MEALIAELLRALGEDPQREGLRKTPERVAKALRFLTRGYQEDPEKVLKSAIFKDDIQEMVMVRNIEFFSLCEHHLLPFFGRAHVAYLPNGYIVGLSKLARLVEIFSRRLQVQERMTRQIATLLQLHLKPKGVGVVLEAQHLCMQMRGVEKQHSEAVTSCMLGAFRNQAPTRQEFLSFIGLASR